LGYGTPRVYGSKVIPCRKHKNPGKQLASLHLPPWRECVIIGGGTSLHDFDFKSLGSHKTIGINKAFIHGPDINYCLDHQFHNLLCYTPDYDPFYVEQWKHYKGIKVFARHHRKDRFHPSVYVVDQVPDHVISQDLAQGMAFGNNSGYGAITLAVALGCQKIFLIGYDFYLDKTRSHWHNGYGKNMMDKTVRREYERKLLEFRDKIADLALPLEALGIKVINCNPKSLLKAFPFGELV
jgi:hypothetical protein